jgi:hypothetical protein
VCVYVCVDHTKEKVNVAGGDVCPCLSKQQSQLMLVGRETAMPEGVCVCVSVDHTEQDLQAVDSCSTVHLTQTRHEPPLQRVNVTFFEQQSRWCASDHTREA